MSHDEYGMTVHEFTGHTDLSFVFKRDDMPSPAHQIIHRMLIS